MRKPCEPLIKNSIFEVKILLTNPQSVRRSSNSKYGGFHASTAGGIGDHMSRESPM
jgi:hypothetical protein